MKKHILIYAGAFAAISLVAVAQYSIDWETIDGGGGISSGGGFELNGTIGQPDAAETASGGSFELTGGFWAIQAVQVAGAPWLDIVGGGANDVIVSWIPAAPGWTLQHNSDLTTNNWVDAVSGTMNPITIPATNAAQFYRLRKLP